MTAPPKDDVQAARRAVAANPSWYHSIELAPGVLTPGRVDLRGVAPKVLPTDLSGRRALDVGTFDGFWAFELERRGAEVVAVDAPSAAANDWPPLQRARLEAEAEELGVELGRGFELVSGVLDSDVRRVECNVYDLSADAVGGPVDLAFAGSILLHLRDPVGGLERIRTTLSPGGTVILLEPFSARQSIVAPRKPVAQFQTLRTHFNWWYPNLATLRDWLLTAGFHDVRRRGIHRQPGVAMMRQWTVALEARRPGNG